MHVFRKCLYFDMPNSLGNTETEIQTKVSKHWQICSPSLYVIQQGCVEVGVNQTENTLYPQNLTLMIVV